MTLTPLLCQFVFVNSLEFKSGAHERKQLRKKSVSFRVPLNSSEAKIIKHDRYLSHDLAK